MKRMACLLLTLCTLAAGHPALGQNVLNPPGGLTIREILVESDGADYLLVRAARPSPGSVRRG
jgi:hypothetical protein